jgi:broad specificity phosphatase PhoE
MIETVNDISDNNDIDLLPTGVNSLSDYTPNKLHLLLSLPLPVDIATFQDPSPINFDNSQNLIKKRSSKKQSLLRFFLPTPHSPAPDKEQDKFVEPLPQPIDPYDMRFFIMRHGERIDRYFGPNWYLSAFNEKNQYRPYHSNFPATLPYRSNKFIWALDTPLTSSGLQAAKQFGRNLASKGFQPTHVYSSPAMRCVITTIQMLKGLGLENKIPIRIEPGLLEIGASRFGMSIFYQPMDWYKYGINVDRSYQPILRHIPSVENEHEYYLRSKYVIRQIENHHHNSLSKLHNILIVGHATSPETLTWDLIGKQPNVNDMHKNSLSINYLQMVAIERRQDNKSWAFKKKRSS